MNRIFCLIFLLTSSFNAFNQENITERSEFDKRLNNAAIKNDGKPNQPTIASQKSDEITEVSLERKGCNGFCPIDKVTFRLNGQHSYKGIRYVDQIGDFQAGLQEYKFNVLVKVLERVNYAELKDEYVRIVDSPLVILSVTRGGKTKTIKSDSSETTPIEFMIIQAFIEDVIPKIRWKKVE